jgi:hypothetical protein
MLVWQDEIVIVQAIGVAGLMKTRGVGARPVMMRRRAVGDGQRLRVAVRAVMRAHCVAARRVKRLFHGGARMSAQRQRRRLTRSARI